MQITQTEKNYHWRESQNISRTIYHESWKHFQMDEADKNRNINSETLNYQGFANDIMLISNTTVKLREILINLNKEQFVLQWCDLCG